MSLKHYCALGFLYFRSFLATQVLWSIFFLGRLDAKKAYRGENQKVDPFIGKTLMCNTQEEIYIHLKHH